MWNSVLMDGVKWSFDRSSPPLTDDDGGSHPDYDLDADAEETQFRSWNFESHQQTNYADWTNRLHPGEEDADDIFVHQQVDGREDRGRRNYPSAAELFRNFVGDESADRMEFYINHLTMEGCDANNIASALMAEAESASTVEESSANVVYRPPFPLLDTITEETVEELLLEMSDSSSLSIPAMDESSESPSSNSGRWGWGWGWLNTSDDDSSSVIHVPVGGGSSAAITSGSLVRHSEMTDVNSGIYRTDGLDVDFDLGNDDDDDDDDDDDFEDNDDGEWSERDQEVPKKKRRIGSSIDEEDKESASSRSPSVTDSLIQFEALEKELVDTESEPFVAPTEESTSAVVFRTSATTLPFEDADDRVLSPEMDPEVFLDCQEHFEAAGGLVDVDDRPVQTSSVNFFNFLDGFQEHSQTMSQEFYTTCGGGSDWFSPPLRSWSSMPSLDRNVEDESITEMRSSRSACDVSNGDSVMDASGSVLQQIQQTYQGHSVALRPSQPWVITFDPPQEIEDEEDEDDQVNDDDHWEPDGFLNSDIEEYDTGSNSDDDDYSTERGDRFDEFGLGFISGRSQRMRSFRSYGDSLNMLDTADDPILHSNSSSSSSCSPDRSSPEEDHRHPASSRSRHSVEALSEDSGYGDASGSLPLMMHQRTSPDNSNNKRAGTSSVEETRMAGLSTPPTKCHHMLELPNSLGLAICLPDGSPPSCSQGNCQWSPEVERATRDEYHDDDWEEEEEEKEEEEKADELRKEDKNEVKDEEMTGQSALLMRRQPKSRPTPLSLKEAEEFLILQDHAAEVIKDGQSRCGVSEICIDLESKMRCHTLDGNAATTTITTTTNDDILRDHPGTDLEASKFNPQIGSSGWEEVPDGMGEAVTAGTDHTQPAEGKEEEKEQQHSLHSNDGGSGFIQPPDSSKHNSASHGHNVTYSDSIAMDSAFYPAPVVLKRYGPRQEVEVYISHQQLPVGSEDLDPPVPTSTTVVPSSSSIRGVHFSPVVSAVNWRESYLNQSEDDSDDNNSTSNGSAVETNAESKKNSSATPAEPPATKVRVAEVSPSVAQKVKLMPDSPPDVVNVIEADRGTQNSGRNESNSNSCTTTSNSATTTTTHTTTTTTTSTSSSTTTGNNSKKPPLFQRFSLSRLSARMSATFSRSDSKRESGKKVVGSDGPIPTDPKDVPTTTTETTSLPVAKGNSKKSSKNKQQPDACPEVKPTSKKIDDFKVVKEPKKRFFSRTFQRSSSTPPMSSSVTAQPEATIQTRATLTAVSPTAVATASAAAGASGSNDNNSGATSSSNVRPIELESLNQLDSVARQQAITSSNVEKNTPPTSPAAIGDSRPSVVVNSTGLTVESESGTCPPIPSPRSKVQASHAKPPLPPQTKPRTIHARKNYLVQPVEPPPPVPMVSSAGLQHALQHFKETARMDRERLANSVPDLVATAPTTPTPRPTSDCIDPRENEVTTAPAPTAQPCRPLTIFPASRERARQAALSRASSVESAWNATASRAVLNLSRRNIASSGSSQDVAGISTSTQGHGRTKSRPVVPGLLETNLDSVPSSYSSSNNYNNPSDETNLDELIQNLQLFCNNNKRAVEYSPQPLSVDSGSATANSSDKRFKSMLNLGSSSAPVSVQPDIDMMMTDSTSSVRVPDPNRAKSMEFLLDEDNKSTVQVPENQLKKCGERKMSEHELRIQRSLQKLNVPEWYKNNARSGIGGNTTYDAAGGTNGSTATSKASATNGSGNVTAANNTGVLRRRDYHGGSVSLRNGGWSGLSSANREAGTASSMTSLGSALSRSGTPTRVVIPTRVRADWRNIKSSRESLSSPAETCNSPSWNGGPTSLSSTQQSFSRWGSGRSSYSTCPSPAPSTSSSASAYRTSLLNQHGRAPYLGWRSQERLNSNPAPLSIYQSPAERLASTLLTTKTGSNDVSRSESRAEAEPTPQLLPLQRQQKDEQQETDEVVRSSIRQVTSAIVHYVSESSDGDQPPSPSSRNGLSRSPERHPLEALSRSPSPRRQRCVWLESSFVGGGTSPTSHHVNAALPSGTLPVRPESPPSSSSGSSHHLHSHRSSTSAATNGRPAGLLSDRTGPLSLVERDDVTSPQPPPLLEAKRIYPPVSATLDDVLNSLLGLAPPSPMHGLLRRPVSQPTIHNKQAHHQQQQDGHGQQMSQSQQQSYQHQQQMRGNNNNNHEGGASRSFNDLRSSSITSNK